jgi:hypothetical protein
MFGGSQFFGIVFIDIFIMMFLVAVDCRVWSE